MFRTDWRLGPIGQTPAVERVKNLAKKGRGKGREVQVEPCNGRRRSRPAQGKLATAAACRRLPPHSTYPRRPHDARSESHGLVGVMFLDEYVRVLSLSLSLFCRRRRQGSGEPGGRGVVWETREYSSDSERGRGRGWCVRAGRQPRVEDRRRARARLPRSRARSCFAGFRPTTARTRCPTACPWPWMVRCDADVRLQPGERGAAVRLAFKQTRDTPARRLHACARWEGEGGQGSNYPLVASRHDALPRRSRRQANSVEWKQKRAGSGLLPCAVPSDQPLFSPPFF